MNGCWSCMLNKAAPDCLASVVPHFARVNSWSTDMRYTPGTMAAHEAQALVEAAIEIITWADGRL